MNYRELNSVDLVKRWRVIVNDNVNIGRDSHLIKEFLVRATPVQILFGMYQYQKSKTISIPQFLKQCDRWLEDDEQWAEIELARNLTSTTPPEYFVYMDLIEEETAYAFQLSFAARQSLRQWADRILA